MASIALALVTLAVTLPAGLPLEFAGFDIGSKMLSPFRALSKVAERIPLIGMTPNISRNEEGHDDAVDLGWNLRLWP
jgi:hypothetical protein